ncbi:MAG: class I SAM-dependent methyltransferase, partial [Chloroflexota bacterium]
HMTVPDVRVPSRTEWKPRPEENMYQSYTTDEDKERTNVHYEQPARFFQAFTGGEWNAYSCNLWDTATNDTESQEAKLDLMAQYMNLKPGYRILDVGCGWAGPLTYLCQKYDVRGVGLTLSSQQKRFADERIARLGVDTQVIECHWREFQDAEGFDAIYTDEVIVHFHNLDEFFAKCHALLKPHGRMVNKELHFTHPSHARLTRATALISEIYGYTGNYRTLAEELTLVNQAGFETHLVHHIPRRHYRKTIKRWQSNMHEHHDELIALVGADYYTRFRKYLKVAGHLVGSDAATVDIVVAQKVHTG